MNQSPRRVAGPRRRLAAIALLASSALAVAACSSNSGSSSTSGSASSAAAGNNSTATGTPILIGGQGDLNAAIGVTDGFQARIDAANKAGGIDGHPIKFLGTLDDALSPQTNLTNSQKLVESDHVVAIAPYVSNICTSSGTGFLAQNKTPFIGWATCAGWLGNQYGIGINGAQVNIHYQATNGMTQLVTAMKNMPAYNVKQASDVKLALIGFSGTNGSFATASLTAAAKAVGIDVVYSQASIPLAATNFAPYAQAVTGAGANAVYEITDAPLAVGLSGALKAAGFKGFAVNGVTYLPGQLASSASTRAALDGVGVESEFPVNEDNSPASQAAVQQLSAAGKSTSLTTGISQGYWSADVLVQLLQATAKRVGAGNITGAALEATVTGGWTYTGGLGTMSYPNAWTYPTGCGTLVQQQGTTYKLLVPYGCSSKVAKLGL
jgi:ABC-type branched-subunit amino acid transport system substrate-binding protein